MNNKAARSASFNVQLDEVLAVRSSFNFACVGIFQQALMGKAWLCCGNHRSICKSKTKILGLETAPRLDGEMPTALVKMVSLYVSTERSRSRLMALGNVQK